MKWDIHDIEQKKKYLKKMIASELDDSRKETMINSFLTFNTMLETSGNIRYTHFYNAINLITLNRFQLIKDKKEMKLVKDIFKNVQLVYSIEYLRDVYNILNKMLGDKKKEDLTWYQLSNASFSDDMLVYMARDFYRELDEELYQNVLKVTSKENKLIHFHRPDYLKKEVIHGRTFYDNFFNRVYCSICHYDNYMDIISMVHELMHANQYFYDGSPIQNKFPIATEAEPKVIEMLMCDYLIEHGFDSIEINKFKFMRQQQGLISAYLVVNHLNKLNAEGKLYDVNRFPSMFTKTLMDAITNLVSNYLYDEIKNDKQVGLDKLKTLMENPLLSKDEPSFAIIGLTNDKMLEVASNYSKETSKIKIK